MLLVEKRLPQAGRAEAFWDDKAGNSEGPPLETEHPEGPFRLVRSLLAGPRC